MALNSGDQGRATTTAPVGRDGPVPLIGSPRADRSHTGGPVVDATLLELVGRFVNDLSELADKQIELAKQEASDTLHDVIATAKKVAIGAGVLLAVALFLIIWAWTGFIWFFNWVGAFFGFGGLGWLVGLLVPLVAAFVAYRLFIQPGIRMAKGLSVMSRTRATLKEDLEWVQLLRTRSAR